MGKLDSGVERVKRLQAISDALKAARRDLRHQRDGLFYDTPQRTTPPKVVLLLLTPEVQLTLLYRVYHTLHQQGLWRTATFGYLFTKRRYSCDIAPAATIGGGLRLTHCSDIVIGPEVVIGDDAVIFNGTTLGNRLGSSELGMPRLGNRVMIGAGAKVLGALTIGDGARVGANAVVLCEVPAHSVAVGIPAQIKTPKQQ